MKYTIEQWQVLSSTIKDRYITKLQSDFRFFCNEMLRIKAKDPKLASDGDSGKVISFVWNEAQEMVWNVCQEQMKMGLPIDVIILKARQLGISTFFLAYLYWRMWRENNVSGNVFAHRKDPTLKALNQTMALFYDQMPPGFKPQMRQHHKDAKVGLNGLWFQDRMSGCDFIVQADGGARGITADLALCTEVAFYKNSKEFFGSYTAAMTRSSDRMLVLESTAAEGWFKDEYFAAKGGMSGARRAIFIPWWRVPSLNSKQIEWRGKRGTTPYDPFTKERIYFDSDEKEERNALNRICKRLGLEQITWEQMYWRQDTIAREFSNDVDQFNQEHPRDEEVAFQYKSKSAFKNCLPIVAETIQVVDEIQEQVEEQGLVSMLGWLRSNDIDFSTSEPVDSARVYFAREKRLGTIDQEHVAGGLEIRAPIKGYQYVIGCDVAGELAADEDALERAASVACVFCLDTREQVFEWRGHISPWDFGTIVVMLAFYYNEAMINLERNNMGISTEDRIKRVLMYTNLFKWPDFNEGLGKLSKRDFWETNPKTKIIMIEEFKRWVIEGLFIVRSPRLYSEMGSYVMKNGKYTTTNQPSDTIIAASLAVMAATQSEHVGRVLTSSGPDLPQTSIGASGRFKRDEAERRNKGDKFHLGVPNHLPEEFNDTGELMQIRDTWEAATF